MKCDQNYNTTNIGDKICTRFWTKPAIFTFEWENKS